MSVVSQLLVNIADSKCAMDRAFETYTLRKREHSDYVQKLADKLRGLAHSTVVNVDGVRFQVVRTPDEPPYLKLVEEVNL